MEILDIIVLLAFSLVIALTAVAFARTGKSMKSFFAGGANVPWWISGLSLFMGFFSAGTFVVWGSIAYDLGIVSMTILSTMCLSGFVVGILLAPKWKKTGVLTVAEFITRRYGIQVQKFYTYMFLVLGLVSAANVLYPVARILNAATGIDIQLFILIIGALIILYTTIGGLWAVMVTDVLQFFILTTAVFIILPLSLDKAGGLSSFIQQAPDNFFQPFAGEYTLWFILAFVFYHIIFLGGNWPYVQRFTSVSTPKTAKKVAFLFGVLYIVSTVIWMLPPMIYKVIHPDLVGKASEGAYLLVAREVLPVGMLGLMLAAMVFATNSTANANLNLISAVFTNDIYKSIFKNTPEKKLMSVARFSNAAFGLIMILMALSIKHLGGIVEVVLSVAAIAGGPLLLPPIWGLFSKKIHGKQAMYTTVISLLLGIFFKVISPFTIGFAFNRAEEMIFGVGFPIVLLILFEVIATVRKYPDTKYKPAYQPTSSTDSGNAKSQNMYSLQIISLSLSIMAVLMLLISIFTNAHQLLLGGISVIILVLSLGIYLGTKMQKKKAREFDNAYGAKK